MSRIKSFWQTVKQEGIREAAWELLRQTLLPWLAGVFGLSVVIAWLSTTWAWYWATFSWAGIGIAFLVSCFIFSVVFCLIGLGRFLFNKNKTVLHGASPFDVKESASGSICELGKYQWSHEQIDAGENHGGKQGFFRLKMPIKFIANAKSVTIRVSVMREITWYLDRRSPQYSWKAVESKDYYTGDVETVTFATVAVNRQHHGRYGDMREDAFLINSTSRHVFTFDVFYEGGKESTKLYLESPSKGVVANPREGLGKLAGLIILQESDNVFAEDWATKGTPAPSAKQQPEGGLW